MGKDTKIEWTDHTWNPWIGCSKISPGCVRCYAETWSKRYGKDIWGPDKQRQRTSAAYWKAPIRWDGEAFRAGERHRVFCASLADVFDEAVPDQWRTDLFRLIDHTTSLDWQLLTKRIAAAGRWIAAAWPNIWLGTSVEDQRRADERIPTLLKIPAVVRFLSVEPMLEPIDLGNLSGISWVILGGESGDYRRRKMELDWARDILAQCRAARVAYFFKQLGGPAHDKGGDLADIPEDLRVREFPSLPRR